MFRTLIAHVRTPLYRNAYALMLSTATTSGLGVLYWALAARYYPAQDVGRSSAAISMMMLLSGLAELNLTSALIRFLPCAGRATGRLIGAAYLVSLAVALVVSLGFVLGISSWAPGQRWLVASPGFTLWFIAATAIWCVFALQDYVLTGLRRAEWVPVANTLFGLAKIALLVGLAGWAPHYGIFASWTIPAAVAIVPINLLIVRRLIPRHSAATESQATPIVPRQIVAFVAGDYVGALFGLLATTLLPLMVLNHAGAHATAFFYLPWTITYPLQLVALNIAASLTVEGAADQARLGDYGQRALAHMLCLLAPLALMLALGAPYLLRVFGADYAAAGAPLLRLLALAALPYSINALYAGLARVQRRIGGVVLVEATVCVLTLSLSSSWLQRYGITGVGSAWLVSQTVVAAIVLLTQLRRYVFFHGCLVCGGLRAPKTRHTK